ncbi:lytic murein transglycosylase [Teredinibacter waterburyi]|jgi:hypothetical protein|uniref:lytic murein transglycosylase n=1 Tax=Teredinibacter waterburyi TaxID=1500538 RepID=UPI00165F4C61|nr:lytic murein transglycosylase [Teredinibacter waterburyi]
MQIAGVIPIDSANDNSKSLAAGEEATQRVLGDASFKAFCDAFRQREQLFTLINQINQLIKVVQKHRGISMGLIGGDVSFQPDFDQLQMQLAKRLATLEYFAESTGGLLSEKDKGNLHLAWATIRQNWQDDNVSDNFELHSHFIDQLRHMLASLARQLEQPLAPELVDISSQQSDAGIAHPKMFKQMELLNFVARQLPDMIEQIAKVRGLSVYAASIGSVDFYNDRKLRYLLTYAREQSYKLRHQAERISGFLGGDLVSFSELKNLELKLLYLLNTVDQDVLSGTEISTSSQQFFKLATEIVDVYWAVVNDGLTLLRRWHEDDMELWLKTAPIAEIQRSS